MSISKYLLKYINAKKYFPTSSIIEYICNNLIGKLLE